jgi:hypothetical protein
MIARKDDRFHFDLVRFAKFLPRPMQLEILPMFRVAAIRAHQHIFYAQDTLDGISIGEYFYKLRILLKQFPESMKKGD